MSSTRLFFKAHLVFKQKSAMMKNHLFVAALTIALSVKSPQPAKSLFLTLMSSFLVDQVSNFWLINVVAPA